MSRTWKHQKEWYRKWFWRTTPDPIYGPFAPNPKSLNEPKHWDFKFYCVDNYGNAKWWYTWSNRKHRRKVRKLLKQGHYTEAQHLKPDNVDRDIC